MKLDFCCKFSFEDLKEAEKKIFSVGEDSGSVLFIIDMNNGFAKKGALSSERIKKIIPDVIKTTELFAKAGEPIIAFTDSHSKNAAEFTYLPEHCVEGTEESELVDELLPYKDKMTVIGKNSTNGFMEPKAQEVINELVGSGYKNWVITGCCTDICVKTFAITLKTFFNHNDFDMNIVVPMDAVETYDAPGHDACAMNLAALYDMRMNGINIVSKIVK